MKYALQSSIVAAAAAAGAVGSAHAAPKAPQRPNIIVIMSDDMGYSDIGCYGGVIETPNLDRLAETGLQYMQFYNTARSCPTRASLLTGLNPHQAGMGHMTENRGEDGYRGEINNHCVTMAEVLQPAGYETYAVGKWHVARDLGVRGPKYNWPLQRGFQHFYGTIKGGGSFFDPTALCRGNDFITPENDPLYKPESFYYTNAIADNAMMFLDSHKKEKDNPFFMYVAFTAAHWPMHLPEEEIACYKGRFDEGWDVIRQRKYENMVARGIIDPNWALSEDPGVEKWADVGNKEFEKRCMEVYAGMVTNLDRNIGRLIAHLRENGQLENTVILFLQDNGACAEPMARERKAFTVKIPDGKSLQPMGPDELQDDLIPWRTRDGRPVWRGQVLAGGADTYVAYGQSWAWVSNTPFREYKHWVHEGGISTPLIVNWPAGIANSGEKRYYPGQLMDIMATVVELSGAEYPSTYNGNAIYPCEGRSLAASFHKDDPDNDRYLYWEHEGNRAIRSGEWKLVYKQQGNDKTVDPVWELYNMKDDRTETRDRAAEYPEKVARMAADWNSWAERCHVVPWPK